MTIIDNARRIAMISAPVGLIAFSLSHATLSWSEIQHLHDAGPSTFVLNSVPAAGRGGTIEYD